MEPRRHDDETREQRLETTRAASARPETWDETDGSVEVCFAAGARVAKYDWRTGETYLEELPVDRLDLVELNEGAHVLRAHETWSLDSVLGSVVPGSARVQGGEALARVRLSRAPSDAEIVEKIRTGIIRKWSFGYQRLGEMTVTKDPDTGAQVRTWASYRPFELSPVPVPADAGAGTRSRATTQEDTMETEQQKAEREAREKAEREEQERQAAIAAAREEGARAEATRQADIQRRAAQLGFAADDETVRAQIADPKIDADAALRSLADERAKRAEKGDQVSGILVVRDETDTFRALASSAMAHRSRSETPLADGARKFAAFGYVDLARECLRRMGRRGVEYMTPDDLFTAALGFERGERSQSTSDFPYILADAANKNFRGGMAQVVENYLPLCERRQVKDFKAVNELTLSSAPTLDETPEGMEIKYGTFSEGKEVWRILSYTKGWRITRKAMINDDTGALGSAPSRFGGGVTRTKLNLFWAMITGNTALADTYGIFHANHSNVTASGGAAPDVDEIGKGRKLMRLQKDIGGLDELNLMPDYLVIPAAQESGVEKLLASFVPAQAADAVPNSIKSLKYIVEPRLDAASVYFWYLLTGAAQWPNFVFGELAGSTGPRFRSRESWDVQGMEFLVEYDCGFAPIDYRGAYRNKGQA